MFNVLKYIEGQYPERKITILAGREEVARKRHGKWYIKTVHCSRCGECCKRTPITWPWGKNEKGHCAALIKDSDGYTCGNGFPYGCLTGDNAGEAHCSIVWTEFAINGI